MYRLVVESDIVETFFSAHSYAELEAMREVAESIHTVDDVPVTAIRMEIDCPKHGWTSCNVLDVCHECLDEWYAVAQDEGDI